MTAPAVIVAGGGLAGAAAAAALAQAGVNVTVFERETAPKHKICGEFLSVEARHYLARLGFDVARLGGHVISHVRLVSGGRCAVAALPFQALGLSRLALDEALLQYAASCGATIRRGEIIKHIDAPRGIVETSGGATLQARILMLATGKHELRGQRRAAPVADFIGFKMHFRLAPTQLAALAAHIELVMFSGGYAGLQLVEEGRANLCLLVRGKWFAQAGGDWATTLAALCRESPHLAVRLAESVPLFTAPLSIARIPYGFVQQDAGGRDLFRLGDQAAVIPSFTGDGMAIALHSADLAVRHVLAGQPASVYAKRLKADVGRQIRRAMFMQDAAATPASRLALIGACRIMPSLLSTAAGLTRLPRTAVAA